jgi:effector-binding domain-containing protein
VAVEVRLPIARGTRAPEGFESVEVASEPVAYTVHHGPAGGLLAAEEVLVAWIRLKALAGAREVRRVYLKRGKNPRKHVTEVQVPLDR